VKTEKRRSCFRKSKNQVPYKRQVKNVLWGKKELKRDGRKRIKNKKVARGKKLKQ